MIGFLTQDPYAVYVVGAYAATALILGGITLQTLRANARARREMTEAEKQRKRR